MSNNDFEELERREVLCECGCGRGWLVSRGRFGGMTFVAMPTIHDDERVVWLALGDGAEPARWACLRSWVDDDNIAAAVLEPEQTPLAAILDASTLWPRAHVVGDDALKARVFETHDALLGAHADLQQLFEPSQGRDFSFMMPDCVFALPAEERSPRNSQNFAELGDRRFVRALLGVPISDGGELRVGVWVEVPEAEFMELVAVFWDDEEAYVKMRLAGIVESSLVVQGENLRGTTVQLAARTADQCLFVAGAEPPFATLVERGISIRALPELIREIEVSVRASA